MRPLLAVLLLLTVAAPRAQRLNTTRPDSLRRAVETFSDSPVRVRMLNQLAAHYLPFAPDSAYRYA
ncbi:MAG: hypothetical protein WBA12_04670, partial [Catalinimonas sp.]